MLNIAGSEPGFAPMGLMAFSLAMMIARFGGDLIRMKLGDRLVLILCSIFALKGLGLLLVIPTPGMVFTGLLMVGLGLSIVVPIVFSIAGNAPGLAPGVGIGMVTMIGYTGFLFGPPIIGFVAEWQDLRIALSLTFVLVLGMTILSFRFQENVEGK